jgi:hypothetical protein
MSRATPRNAKGGWSVWLTAGSVGLRPLLRSPGPWSRRSRWSRRRRRPLSAGSCALPSFGMRVSAFCGRRWLPVGTISAHGPDTGFGALPTMRGAPLGVTPGSIGFGSPTSPGQPAVVFPLATPARRSSRPSPRPSPRRGYRRGSRSALETGLRSRSEADVEREGIIVGVVSPCFSFSFAFFQQASL